ncbi:MAG: hypothetical protein KAR76_03700 [Methanosarcinales archaeon]|nr:hypothetical protein [Methanosarcinales archaeon]
MILKKTIIIEMVVIVLLMLTLGCVSEYEVDYVEPAKKPTVEPTEEPEFNEIETNETTPTPSLTPTPVEIYDDEQFLTWIADSMSLMRSETVIANRIGNWGKLLKENAAGDQIELKEFHVSPENQIIAEQYEHALETYRLAGYYAEYDTTRTEGFSEMDTALISLGYGEFQFGIVEALLKPDTMLMNEPAEYTSVFSLNRFSLPIDLMIPAGTTIKWQNRELKKTHRYLISEDGLWEEPIDISYMRYHEHTFNETGTFNFSLKSSEIPDRQMITVR